MTAASITSAFITDAIAAFKGRLDTLMEESLTKYREKTIAEVGDDYTPGYGEITELAGASYTTYHHRDYSSGGALPTEIPTGKFNKDRGVWIVHSFSYINCNYEEDGYGGDKYLQPFDCSGVAFDNYGNWHKYYSYTTESSWDEPVVGNENYNNPLPDVLIDAIKTLPSKFGTVSDYDIISVFRDTISTLLKSSAGITYKTRHALKQTRKEMEVQRAKITALEAEIRALKGCSPPSENLFGLTGEPPKAAAAPLASAIMEM